MFHNLKFHHLGYVVSSISKFEKKDNLLTIDKPLLDFKDYEQNARVCFYQSLINAYVEIIEPLDKNSHLWNYLNFFKDGGYHHICFETSDFKKTLSNLESNGYKLITHQTIGFESRNVVFLLPKKQIAPLIEIVSLPPKEKIILPKLI